LKTIWLGMSGGVDSSAAAWLLKQQGYTVVGITLRLHGQADRDCADARRVCDKLGMEHRILDGRERFAILWYFRFIVGFIIERRVRCICRVKQPSKYVVVERGMRRRVRSRGPDVGR